MSSYIPLIVILLALIAAGSIAVIAWHLSSDEFHKSLEGDDQAAPRDDAPDGHGDSR